VTGDTRDPLVSADWVAENLDHFRATDSEYRLVEVSIRDDTYESAHIPGAVSLDWQQDLRDAETFDVISPSSIGELLGQHGITADTTVVLYGDFFNWFAAHAYWLLRYYQHESLRLLDGGRKYWIANNYPTTASVPDISEACYETPVPDESIRVRRADVESAVDSDGCLLDVRAPPEYRGEILSPPGWNEGVQRGGHIPGAINKPCRCTMGPDRRFKSRTELETIFSDCEDAEETIVYCRVGERSALVWFVLSELLGQDNVSYYYGSFVEWGNTVGLPVESPSSADLR
jgi:thiosulfate/3-mercaptopyruvate sulfurtransferase